MIAEHAAVSGRPLPALWRAVGAVCRGTPHFREKWRICSALLDRFVRGRGYETTVRFDRTQRMRVALDDWITYQVFLTGFYDVETYQTRLFCRLVRPGMTVFDVGANVGYYTLLAAARVGPSGAVHAFEPVARTFERLRANAELNGWRHVVLNHNAVSDRRGTVAVSVADAGNTGMASVVADGESTVAPDRPIEQVEAIALDEYVERHGIAAVDLVKIDVEGSELQVLRGMDRLLAQRAVQLLVEVSPPALQAHGGRASDVLDLLRGHGFGAYRIGAGGLTPMTSAPAVKESLVLFTRGA